MKSISDEKRNQIVALRKCGHSYLEIRSITSCGFGTVYRYAKNVEVKGKFLRILKEKQGGSRVRSQKEWQEFAVEAKNVIGQITKRDSLLVLSVLYWGEGTKSDFNIINGDASMLAVFLGALKNLHVQENDIILKLRVFEGVNQDVCIEYWSRALGVSKEKITIGEVVKGNGKNKLPYGMCRLRIRKGGQYFKLVMCMIEYLRSELCPRSSTDRTVAS